MISLGALPLPLSTNGPPADYLWPQCDNTSIGAIAFKTGIDRRDKFLGIPCCVVCGDDVDDLLQYCHIIPKMKPMVVS